MLVNVVTQVPDDVHERIHLRSQLSAAGMMRILPKLEALDYHLLNLQIEAYKIASENDLEDAFGDELSVYSDVSHPNELFELVLDSIAESPRAQDHLVSTLRGMLLIKGDPENKSVPLFFIRNTWDLFVFFRAHYHRMISELVNQIVMDRRTSVASADFSSTYGVSVGNLIQKFSDLDRLQQLEEEVTENRERLLRLSAENKEMQLELEHWRSKGGAPPEASMGDSGRNASRSKCRLRTLAEDHLTLSPYRICL